MTYAALNNPICDQYATSTVDFFLLCFTQNRNSEEHLRIDSLYFAEAICAETISRFTVIVNSHFELWPSKSVAMYLMAWTPGPNFSPGNWITNCSRFQLVLIIRFKIYLRLKNVLDVVALKHWLFEVNGSWILVRLKMFHGWLWTIFERWWMRFYEDNDTSSYWLINWRWIDRNHLSLW